MTAIAAEPKILVACQPKSGSTYVSEALCAQLGLPRRILHESPEVQELSRRKVNPKDSNGFVGQSHVLPTKNSVRLINEAGVAVVVLERGLADCLISLHDMYLERIESQEGVWKGEFISQFGCFGPFFSQLDAEQRLDYLIACAAPWYLKFAAGWRSPSLGLADSPIFVRYEDFFHDANSGLEALLEELGLTKEAEAVSLPSIETDPKRVRFNVGRVGRGFEALSDQQKRTLWEMAEIHLTGRQIRPEEVLGFPQS